MLPRSLLHIAPQNLLPLGELGLLGSCLLKHHNHVPPLLFLGPLKIIKKVIAKQRGHYKGKADDVPPRVGWLYLSSILL